MYLSPTIIILLKYPLIYEVQGQEADSHSLCSISRDRLTPLMPWVANHLKLSMSREVEVVSRQKLLDISKLQTDMWEFLMFETEAALSTSHWAKSFDKVFLV